MGVPIVTEVSNTENKPSRNTVAQCYEAIIKDLKEEMCIRDSGGSLRTEYGYRQRYQQDGV